MRFALTAIISAVLVAAGVNAAATPRAQQNPNDCLHYAKYTGIYHGNYQQSCVHLIYNCMNTLNSTNSRDPWGTASCVASATCWGTHALDIYMQCQDPTLEPSQFPTLNYNIYASIVGDCAYQEGGCPITFQNYVDFVYGQLSAVNSTDWPGSVDDVAQNWWNPIKDWTATGDSIPYTNFNDWLFYSDSQ
ncbi:hypothetical protein CYLTODRAFT_424968 [Cylindrobasidium torrendii FP15055 ss-10]|uniref:Uncharacterized protein n=1 Tax=Cylindrobasidium torrendii FP15055 ss-10 TaxID=1314674 RepID=A0A0D7B5B4_9AGAR|nr:hypothetical protein CYLTODRAFT_424968 [Cylindrobasidium torrendii FP15055 ss-10]